MQKPTYIGQTLYINPTYIVSIPNYYYPEKLPKRSKSKSILNLKSNEHNGKISKKASMKIKNAVNWLLVSAKDKRVYSKKSKKHFRFKINFFTLTLPYSTVPVTAKVFKSILFHNMIQTLRNRRGLKNYIWRIERMKNGRLHVHVTTDTFIHHADLKRYWNQILEKNGILNEWYLSKGNYSPPSTEIHTVKNVKDLGAYLCKYLSKNESEGDKISGKLWGSNYELSHANRLSIEVFPNELKEYTAGLWSKKVRYKVIESKPNLMGTTHRIGEIFFMDSKVWRDVIKGGLKEVYDNHRFNIRHNLQEVPKLYVT